MNRKTVIEAANEAQRFIKVADKLLYKYTPEDWTLMSITGCKESAALKRASMDLTRILADLRMGR